MSQLKELLNSSLNAVALFSLKILSVVQDMDVSLRGEERGYGTLDIQVQKKSNQVGGCEVFERLSLKRGNILFPLKLLVRES